MGVNTNHIVSRLPLRESWKESETDRCVLDLSSLKAPAPHPALEVERLPALDLRILDHRHTFPMSAAVALPDDGLLAVGLSGGWQIRRREAVVAEGLQEQPTSLCFEKENGRIYLNIASSERIRSYNLSEGVSAASNHLLKRTRALAIDPQRGEVFCAQDRSGRDSGGSAIVAAYRRKGAVSATYFEIYKSENALVTALALWPGRHRCLAIGLSSGEIEVRRVKARGESGGKDLLLAHRIVQNAPITALSFSADRTLLAADGLGGVHEINFSSLPLVKISSTSPRSARLRGAVRALTAGQDGVIHTYFGSRCL